MSSFQKSIINPFFKRIHSIFLNMIFTKIYYNMDSLNFDNVNVEYEFIF